MSTHLHQSLLQQLHLYQLQLATSTNYSSFLSLPSSASSSSFFPPFSAYSSVGFCCSMTFDLMSGRRRLSANSHDLLCVASSILVPSSANHRSHDLHAPQPRQLLCSSRKQRKCSRSHMPFLLPDPSYFSTHLPTFLPSCFSYLPTLRCKPRV